MSVILDSSSAANTNTWGYAGKGGSRQRERERDSVNGQYTAWIWCYCHSTNPLLYSYILHKLAGPRSANPSGSVPALLLTVPHLTPLHCYTALPECAAALYCCIVLL
jgi:hypothetical protein